MKINYLYIMLGDELEAVVGRRVIGLISRCADPGLLFECLGIRNVNAD